MDVCAPFPSLLSLYVETLTPSVALFGEGASKEVIKFKWGHKERQMRT